MQYVALLGRQPELGLAELEQVFGADATTPFSPDSALVEADDFDIQAFGGSIKAGKVVQELTSTSWQAISKALLARYTELWGPLERKQTLGVSVYGIPTSPRDIQTFGLVLKRNLKLHGTSLRLVPNSDPALSSAVSHHNKLGLSDNKVELLIFAGKNGRTVIAESVGAQNITALARRDQGRPKRDAFVGMLPPKLALMMLNLAGTPPKSRVLDPFCGTGVILQEAMLRGHDAYGTDLSQKMVDYTTANLEWLKRTHHAGAQFEVSLGDAIEAAWSQPIGAVVTETYLGQPFSAPPAPDKLEKVRRICDHIIARFLENAAPQLTTGTPLCLAVPAWRDSSGNFTYLKLPDKLADLGYSQVKLAHVPGNLLYFREDQIVARELLILTKA